MKIAKISLLSKDERVTHHDNQVFYDGLNVTDSFARKSMVS